MHFFLPAFTAYFSVLSFVLASLPRWALQRQFDTAAATELFDGPGERSVRRAARTLCFFRVKRRQWAMASDLRNAP